MTVLAFIYNDYYCYGIQNSFAGRYADEKEAKNILLGDRYGQNCNLELLDLENCGITKFYWKPKYDYKSENDKDYLKANWEGNSEWFEIEKIDWERVGIHGQLIEIDPRYSQGYWGLSDNEI